VVAAFSLSAALAQTKPIDTNQSLITIHVGKTGLLSTFGHEHEIAAPVAGGVIDVSARQVEVQVNTRSLQVRDAGISEKDRAEIHGTMLGPQVLDAERYPEIVFRSTSVDPSGDSSWKLRGTLTLHGQTHPVTVEAHETGGRYVGSARFRQTEFGIQPIRIAGGAVRVKDELRIEFTIVPRQ
jgi:polyisoprenoid-binding protein YceI